MNEEVKNYLGFCLVQAMHNNQLEQFKELYSLGGFTPDYIYTGRAKISFNVYGCNCSNVAFGPDVRMDADDYKGRTILECAKEGRHKIYQFLEEKVATL